MRPGFPDGRAHIPEDQETANLDHLAERKSVKKVQNIPSTVQVVALVCQDFSPSVRNYKENCLEAIHSLFPAFWKADSVFLKLLSFFFFF